jgi:acetyltransferase-like isoleucine patch superfamily enzyme
VRIGDGCGLSNLTIVCRESIDILEGTLIGGGCRIYDNDFHQLDPEARLANQGNVASAPICIGPRAFVGGHCIVLKGVKIGEGAVIGAGSLVTKSVPPWEVWAGVPARYIKKVAKSEDVLTDLKTA